MVEGKNEEMSTSELSGGARIYYILQSIFVNSLKQAINKAATMKSTTELVAAQANEISKKLKADGPEIKEKETKQKCRVPYISIMNPLE
ncbi:Dynamin-related protein 3A [Arachis hypogaea]|nr:Dynamin-related protein 3A [Arachis hypogaea]